MRLVEQFIALVYRTPGAGAAITNIKEHQWGITFRWHDDFDCAGVLQADGTVMDYAEVDAAQFDPANQHHTAGHTALRYKDAETYCKQIMSDCLLV